jgi:hypothetical protein
MTPLETLKAARQTLKAARQLITDPAKWTQNAFARDKNGKMISPTNNGAVCFCALGAIRFVTKEPKITVADIFLNAVSNSKNGEDLDTFNDTHTHAEVLALFDAAIAELEGVQS